MQNKRIYLFTKYATELIMMFFFIILVVPGFKTQGHFFRQLFITSLFTGCFVLLAERVRVKPVVFGHGLAVMSGFWIAVAIYNQIKEHVASDDNSISWYHLFGYDKPAVMIMVYVITMLFFMTKLFFCWENKLFVRYYRELNMFASVTFIIFMAIIWVYGFWICRSYLNYDHYINLTPFNALKQAFFDENSKYDLYVFFGNIGIFIPFGMYTAVAMKGKAKWTLLFIPLIVSTLIELSQYYLGNGESDIDDVIMNTFGFYIGVLFKLVTDRIIQTRTKGAIKSFFIF